MDAVVSWLNSVVATLSAINPAWYVVVVGPLAYATQRALKAEEGFVKAHGTLAALLFSFGSAGFLALMQAASVQQFLAHTVVVGSPIYVIANQIYQHVKQQVEADSAQATQPPSDTNPTPSNPTPAPEGV